MEGPEDPPEDPEAEADPCFVGLKASLTEEEGCA